MNIGSDKQKSPEDAFAACRQAVLREAALARRRRFLARLGGVLLAAAGAGAILAHAVRGAGGGLPPTAPPPRPATLWCVHDCPPVSRRLRPVVAAGTVIVPVEQGRRQLLTAFGLADGRRRWQAAFSVLDQPVANRDTVFMWAADHGEPALLAVSAGSGEVRWSYRPAFAARPAGLAADGDSICLFGRNSLQVLDAHSGAVRWGRAFARGQRLASRPLPAAGGIFVVAGRKLLAFGLDNGALLWEKELDERPPELRPAVLACRNGLLAMGMRRSGSKAGMLCAMDAASGRELWRRETGAPEDLSMAPDLMILVKSAQVEAFSGRDGSPLWAGGAPAGCSPLAIHGGLVYSVQGRRGREITMMERDSGRIAGRFPLDGGSCGGLLVSGNRGVVSTLDGRLLSLALN